MPELKKFLFDLDFEKKETDTKVTKKTEPTLNPDEIPIFSRLEVNQYKEEHEKIGFDKGFNKGKEQALNEINEKLVLLVSNLLDQFNTIEEKNNERLKNINKDSIKISLEIAKKLSSAYSNIKPEENVSSFLMEIFDKYKEVLLKEKIKIYVNDSIKEEINHKLENNSLYLKNSDNFELIGDSNLHINDSKIEWDSGGINKNYHEIEKEINNKINNFISEIDNKLDDSDYKEEQNKSSEEDNQSFEKNLNQSVDSEIEEDKENEDDIKTVGGSKSIKYD